MRDEATTAAIAVSTEPWTNVKTELPLGKIRCWYLLLCNTYISCRRGKIKATGVKFIICICDEVWGEEDVQQTAERPPVPVISDSATIVTFSSHIAKSFIWHLLDKARQ